MREVSFCGSELEVFLRWDLVIEFDRFGVWVCSGSFRGYWVGSIKLFRYLGFVILCLLIF